MRPLGWALILYDWCPHGKRVAHRHSWRDDPVKTQAEDGRLHTKKPTLPTP